MIKVCFDSPKAWAMLNYCRDHVLGCLDKVDTWDDLKDDYIDEAEAEECQQQYVITEDEMEKILKAVTRS